MKNKLVTLLLSLLIAFALWAYVITVVDKESDATYRDIPIVLTNESALTERGLMVTTETMPTVSLHLSGKRTDLNKLSSSNITLSVDLSKILEEGQQLLSYSIYYPENIPDDAFVIEGQTPTRITLNVEKRVSKEVPIQLVYSGNVPEGYMCDTENPVLDYSYVAVVGPNSVIERITTARIDVDLTDRVESIVEACRFTLCDEAGEPVDAKLVTANVEEINLTVKIQRFKEVPLTLTVVDGGGATEATSQIDINPLTIKISGSDMLLEELTEINLGTINLADVTENSAEMSFPIKLPEGVTNLTNVTEAQVTISFPNLRTATFKVTNIQAMNVPEGLSAELVTQELQVTIRGPKEIVNIMRDSDLSVIVDLTGASLGTSTFKASVILASDFGGVGAIGSYTVNVTVQEAVEEEAYGANGADT